MKDKMKKKGKNPASAAGVDLAELGRLVEFLTERGLEEFEYTKGDLHIRVKRPSVYASGNFHSIPAPEILISPATAHSGSAVPAPAPPHEGSGEAVRSEDLHLVKSPIVGTFYGSPSPGAESFVRIGDHVESGQVLCIIEAMKLMNEIESDIAGEVLKIFVQIGQPVEYGEPLFGIRPSRKK